MKPTSKIMVFGLGLLLLALVWMTTADVANAQFTDCRNSGEPGTNAGIFIQDGALQSHDQSPPQDPPYMPVVGDQVAVFTTRPALDPPVCVGMIVWAGDGVVNQFAVWEQNGPDVGIEEGEEMELRIWDSTNDRIFALHNIQWHPAGTQGPEYTRGGVYAINSATPTAVTLQSLTATAATPMLFIVLLIVALMAGTAVALRRRQLAA